MTNPLPTAKQKWIRPITVLEALDQAEIGTFLIISAEEDQKTDHDVWYKIDGVSWKRHIAGASTNWMSFHDSEKLAEVLYRRTMVDWWSLS